MQRIFVTYCKVILLISFTFVSCENRNIIDEPQPDPTSQIIRWDIHAGDGDLKISNTPQTKAMVENDAILQHFCTPISEGGKGESIGFWADYFEKRNSGDYVTVKDVFGAHQTRLIYASKDEGPVTWNYEGTDLPWAIGGKYKVRAFYPQSVSSLIVEASTDANIMALEYNSHQNQTDLMIAYNEVHTKDPVKGSPTIAIANNAGEPQVSNQINTGDPDWYGLSQDFNLNNPIPLFFKHALSAIRVRFVFAYEDEDELMGCIFSNKKREDGFHTVGVLVYGDEENTRTVEANRGFRWITYQSTFNENPTYSWEVADGVQGIPFSTKIEGSTTTEIMAIGYSQKDQTHKRVTTSGTVTQDETIQGTRSISIKKTTPPFYNENDGWVLILPQRQKPEVQLEYFTKKYGSLKVDLPLFTGTLEDGTLSNDPNLAQYLVAGKRYTYTVTVRKTNVSVGVTVEPWEELYVAYDMIF